jgi:hypothetical protein
MIWVGRLRRDALIGVPGRSSAVQAWLSAAGGQAYKQTQFPASRAAGDSRLCETKPIPPSAQKWARDRRVARPRGDRWRKTNPIWRTLSGPRRVKCAKRSQFPPGRGGGAERETNPIWGWVGKRTGPRRAKTRKTNPISQLQPCKTKPIWGLAGGRRADGAKQTQFPAGTGGVDVYPSARLYKQTQFRRLARCTNKANLALGGARRARSSHRGDSVKQSQFVARVGAMLWPATILRNKANLPWPKGSPQRHRDHRGDLGFAGKHDFASLLCVLRASVVSIPAKQSQSRGSDTARTVVSPVTERSCDVL